MTMAASELGFGVVLSSVTLNPHYLRFASTRRPGSSMAMTSSEWQGISLRGTRDMIH